MENVIKDINGKLQSQIELLGKVGCPYCSGKNTLVTVGINDLQTKFPEIAKEADGWDPREVKYASGKKLNWKCELGHKWEAPIANRTVSAYGCPYCKNIFCLGGFNDLQTKFPEMQKRQMVGIHPKSFLVQRKKCLGNAKKVISGNLLWLVEPREIEVVLSA